MFLEWGVFSERAAMGPAAIESCGRASQKIRAPFSSAGKRARPHERNIRLRCILFEVEPDDNDTVLLLRQHKLDEPVAFFEDALVQGVRVAQLRDEREILHGLQLAGRTKLGIVGWMTDSRGLRRKDHGYGCNHFPVGLIEEHGAIVDRFRDVLDQLSAWRG